MKYDIKFKRKAHILRKQGLSYNEIRRLIPVAKSTLSLWLKDVPLSAEHRKRLYTKQIKLLTLGPRSQKERRAQEIDRIIDRAKQEIKLPLSFQAYQLLGAMLYWAEGSKRKGFEVTNSDPVMILFMVEWMKKVFQVSPNYLKARLNIYPQQDEKQIKKFWSDLTGIPLSNFGKSYVKPISTGYKSNNLYYGTVKIYMPKSINHIHRVFGWIQAIMIDIKPRLDVTSRRWQSLTKTKRPANLPP